MKSTIKDIAKLAGVSTATVSKVINNKDQNISQSTRERVLALAKEHKYIPNRIARGLVTRYTKTIGLIIPDITNPFFPGIARGVEDKASVEGYNIIYCNTDDNLDKEDKCTSMLIEKMVDGVIIVASDKRKNEFKNLSNVYIPVILVDRDIDIDGIKGKVLVDNFDGAYQGVNHLLSIGKRNIVFITGPMTTNTAIDRLKGYKKALEEYDIPFKKEYVLEGVFKKEWGYKATDKLIKEGIKFDALFCGNDLIAISAIKALKDNKISVPDDVAVVGYDDIYISTLVDPELTTISQPNYDMGFKAAEMLVDMIEERKIEENRIVLKTELKIRKST